MTALAVPEEARRWKPQEIATGVVSKEQTVSLDDEFVEASAYDGIRNTLIEELRTLKPEPGDVVVVTLPSGASRDSVQSLGEVLRGAFPDNQVFIHTTGTRIDVASP